jgi:hypothetical protein
MGWLKAKELLDHLQITCFKKSKTNGLWRLKTEIQVSVYGLGLGPGALAYLDRKQ